MNSKKRLLTALNCEIPDRVPISLYGLMGVYDYPKTEVAEKYPSYKKIIEAEEEKTDIIAMWNPSSNQTFLLSSYPVEMDREEYEEKDKTVYKTKVHTPRGDLTQKRKTEAGVATSWEVEHWCKNIKDVDKAFSVPYEPLEYDASRYDFIKKELGEKGIIMPSLADPLCVAAGLMKFEDYIMWAVENTDHFVKTLDIIHERNMENIKRMLSVNVSVLYRIVGPEYATPPFLPPKFFKKFVVPYVKEMVDLIHSYGGKVRLHCHGNIKKVLDMILETGADAIDPCEPPPDGDITLSELKKKVGKRVSIFGNIETRVLKQSSTAELEKIIKEGMESAKAGGGYVMMPTAGLINAPLSTKTIENYLNFIDFAHKYGRY